MIDHIDYDVGPELVDRDLVDRLIYLVKLHSLSWPDLLIPEVTLGVICPVTPCN